MKDNTDAISQVRDEAKGLREDLQPGQELSIRQVQADIRAIKERLCMI
jgi:hypothetical protein